jgi:hypothetical protein
MTPPGVTTASSVGFTLNNSTQQLLRNPGFEGGDGVGWIGNYVSLLKDYQTSVPVHSGQYFVGFGGFMMGDGTLHSQSISQNVTIPADTPYATLAFWLRVESRFTGAIKDTLKIQVRSAGGDLLATLASYSNVDVRNDYLKKRFDLSAYRGQTIQIYVESNITDLDDGVSFFLDDFSLVASQTQPVQVQTAPETTAMVVNERRQFSATVSGAADTRVNWSLLEGATGGTVDANGWYTAPPIVGDYHLVATSAADGKAGSQFSIKVTTADGGRIMTLPHHVTLAPGGTQQFTVAMADTIDPRVWWSYVWTPQGSGSITNSGLYTAPLIPGEYTVQGQSISDGIYDNATVTVSAAAGNATMRQALFVNASTSANKTSIIRLVNTSSSAGSIIATAYDESGATIGSVSTNLGAIAANQTLTFTSAQIESALGFTPVFGTSKYSVYFATGLPDLQLINYTRDAATGKLTLSQSQTTDRITGAQAYNVTRSAWFMSASTSANKTNVLRILNTSNQSGALSATVYDEAGNLLGSADTPLGTINSHQMLSYTSAQLEEAIGFAPAGPTVKYRAVFSANLPSLELINFTRDIATGNLTLVQAQIDDRPAPSAASASRNVLLVYPSSHPTRYTALRIINPNAAPATLTAIAYDEAGNGMIAGSLGALGANQILALTSAQIEAALGYAPASSSALYRLAISADVPSFEVVNDAKELASGNLYLTQAQTDSRAVGSASSTARNAYIIYPSSGATTSQLEVINTASLAAALSATAFDESGASVASNVALGTLAPGQMLTFTSAQLEGMVGYAPPTGSATWRIIFSANSSNFEVINYARDASGLLVLAQPQTE